MLVGKYQVIVSKHVYLYEIRAKLKKRLKIQQCILGVFNLICFFIFGFSASSFIFVYFFAVFFLFLNRFNNFFFRFHNYWFDYFFLFSRCFYGFFSLWLFFCNWQVFYNFSAIQIYLAQFDFQRRD